MPPLSGGSGSPSHETHSQPCSVVLQLRKAIAQRQSHKIITSKPCHTLCGRAFFVTSSCLKEHQTALARLATRVLMACRPATPRPGPPAAHWRENSCREFVWIAPALPSLEFSTAALLYFTPRASYLSRLIKVPLMQKRPCHISDRGASFGLLSAQRIC